MTSHVIIYVRSKFWRAILRGIYKLNFQGTDAVYIGQAENIQKRYKEHLANMLSGRASKKLLEAFKKYGAPSYEVLCEIPSGSMDAEENSAIEIFDSANSGFNTFRTEGGSIRGLSGLGHGNSKYSKISILRVFSLLYKTTMPYRKIAEKTKVNPSLVSNILQGVHNWLATEYPEQYQKMLDNRAIRNAVNVKSLSKVVLLKSPTGELFKVQNIRQFCMLQPDLSRNLESARSSIAKVIRGVKPSHLGWILC